MRHTSSAIALIALLHGAVEAQISRPPNVVIITVDDLGWTDLSSQGSTYYETPHVDGLAAQGIRFTAAYSAAAMCSPSRAAVLTGRYPARMGITDYIRSRYQGAQIPADGQQPNEYRSYYEWPLAYPPNALWMEHEEVTIAEVLRKAGYRTGHIGKWHLGADEWYPETQGFDINIGGSDLGEPTTYFDPYVVRERGMPNLPSKRPGEYLTDREAYEAVQFIEESADRPFFLYYAPYAVHTPLQARPGLVDRYSSKPRTSHNDPIYAAMVHSVDQAVGAILDALDRAGQAENTLVIFTSDNGGLADGSLRSTSNDPLRSGKGTAYEGGIRVPFIVRWPGVVPSASVSYAVVMGIDILPTVAAATGVPLPEGRVIDGVSLLDHLRSGGISTLAERPLFWHFPHYSQVTPYTIVRKGDWKLIKWLEGRVELYNVQEDIGETVNLAAALPSKVAELDALIVGWYAETQAKLPRPNPSYRK